MNLEKPLIIIFVILFLWTSVGTLFDYQLSHDFPFAHLASDTFQHQTRTEAIKAQGNYLLEPFWIVAGFKDNPGFYPPLMYHIGVLLSYASGIETWDIAYFFIFLFVALAMVIAYYTIKKYNHQVALLSLPLMFLVFSKYNQIAFTWGFWPSLVAQSFLIFFIWQLSNLKFKYSFIPLGLFFAGAFLAHSSEAIVLGFFMIFYLITKFLLKKLDFSEFKIIFASGLVAAVVMIYYFYIFMFTWTTQQYSFFTVLKDWPGIHFMTYTEFGIYAIFITLGIIIALIKFKKQWNTFVFFALFMLVMSYGNYWGFASRSFNLRFFWPIYLSIFFGIGVLTLAKLIIKKWSYTHSFILSCFLMILVLNIGGIGEKVSLLTASRFTSQGIMDPYHWEMFDWIRKNTEQDSTIYFLFGDIYDQNAMLRNTQRKHVKVFTTQYIEAIKNQTILRYYPAKLHGDDHGVGYAHPITLFKWGYYENDLGGNYTRRNWDVCSMDYYVIDKVSKTPVLAQYNVLVGNELLKNQWIQVVFQNQVIVILKNNNPGEVCMNDIVKLA